MLGTSTAIKSIVAFEALDSRGYPTVGCTITTKDGVSATALVPSGASTGEREALELRDGDKKRYNGKGVLKAVTNVNKVIAPAIIKKGFKVTEQKQIDQFMINLDGTAYKLNLGANAILSVSMAVCKLAAIVTKKPLYKYIGESL
jgi:enolase